MLKTTATVFVWAHGKILGVGHAVLFKNLKEVYLKQENRQRNNIKHKVKLMAKKEIITSCEENITKYKPGSISDIKDDD